VRLKTGIRPEIESPSWHVPHQLAKRAIVKGQASFSAQDGGDLSRIFNVGVSVDLCAAFDEFYGVEEDHTTTTCYHTSQEILWLIRSQLHRQRIFILIQHPLSSLRNSKNHRIVRRRRHQRRSQPLQEAAKSFLRKSAADREKQLFVVLGFRRLDADFDGIDRVGYGGAKHIGNGWGDYIEES